MDLICASEVFTIFQVHFLCYYPTSHLFLYFDKTDLIKGFPDFKKKKGKITAMISPFFKFMKINNLQEQM
ncbi:hypothetical protein, partial [Acinetobacter pittii]|jgi:energy-converting hydrogenase Eha subunit F|uniref:hypothetical protein n=1 Tax=Acinetobacter pittii TaxID=48296 RepID=UPI00355B46C1